MALAGFEWVILGLVVVGLYFVLRPKAITDVAKSMGQVVAEFKKGKQEQAKNEKKEELLAEIAERLGIRTEGKTPSQIRQEILTKAGRDEN